MALTGYSNGSLVQVGIAMVLEDQFTNQAGRISASFRGMMNDVNDWNRGIGMSVQAAYQAGKQMIEGMYNAYQYSAGVSNQIFLAAKMSGASAIQQKQMLKTAEYVNSITPLSASDVASGERFLAMAGNTPSMLQKMIKPASELASIFSMPLGQKGGVADLVTNIMATFNIPASQAARVVDILGIAATSTNMSLNDLALSFQYSGAEMRNAKLSMQDAAAAIGVLGDQGIQGSRAGTALANMYRYLALSIVGQKKKGYSALKAIGIDPKSLLDSRGNLLELDKIVRSIGDHLGKNAPTVRATPFFYNVVGVRGTKALSALVQDYWSGRNKLTKVMSRYRDPKYNDWTNKTMEQFLQTPQGHIEQFESNLENLKVSFGATMNSVFNPLVLGLSKIFSWTQKIMDDGIGPWIVRWGAMAIMIQTGIQGYRVIHGVITMIVTMTRGQVAAQNDITGAVMRTNTVYTTLIAQLRTMVALQMQMVGMQMAPGTRMVLPMGGTLGKSKSGRITVGVPRSVSGNGMTTISGYAESLGGSGAAMAAGAAVEGSVIRNTAVEAGETAARGTLATFGGRILGFLGGPWGLAITTLLPIVVELLAKIFGLDSDTSDQTIKLQQENNRMQSMMDQNFQRGIQNAVSDGVIQGNSRSRANVNVNVNGVGGSNGSNQNYSQDPNIIFNNNY